MQIPVEGLKKADLYVERTWRGRLNRDALTIDGVEHAAGTVVYDRFWSELPVRIGKPLGLPNMWDGEYRFHVAAKDEFATPPMTFVLTDLPCMGTVEPEREDADVCDADVTDNS